jgi:hypothetical protein
MKKKHRPGPPTLTDDLRTVYMKKRSTASSSCVTGAGGSDTRNRRP